MPHKRKTSNACVHNEFDTVRAHKGKATLRCRICQKQCRVADISSSKMRCKDFNTPEGCRRDDCGKLHIHYKKQTLETRCSIHGKEIMKSVRGVSESRMLVLNMMPSRDEITCTSPIPSLCSIGSFDEEQQTDSSNIQESEALTSPQENILLSEEISTPPTVSWGAYNIQPFYCVYYVDGIPYTIPTTSGYPQQGWMPAFQTVPALCPSLPGVSSELTL